MAKYQVADINDLKLRLYIDGLLVSGYWEGTYLQEILNWVQSKLHNIVIFMILAYMLISWFSKPRNKMLPNIENTLPSTSLISGDTEQTFVMLQQLLISATGDNIQWYDGKNKMIDGQMVYASQTVNGCEN